MPKHRYGVARTLEDRSSRRSEQIADRARADGIQLTVSLREVPASSLRPSERVDRKAVQKIARSMVNRGWCGPRIIVEPHRGGLRLVDGNHRLRAALTVGLRKVPVAVVSSATLDYLFHRRGLDAWEVASVLEIANPGVVLRSAGTHKKRTSW